MEPPPLKIRIFKGNSGELINEKEARRSKKRKKRTQKDKEKVKKIATEKGKGKEIKSLKSNGYLL